MDRWIAGINGRIAIAHSYQTFTNNPPKTLNTDETYLVSASVTALGQSPKTEYLWFDALASGAAGRGVASMRMLLRFMKASSALYA